MGHALQHIGCSSRKIQKLHTPESLNYLTDGTLGRFAATSDKSSGTFGKNTLPFEINDAICTDSEIYTVALEHVFIPEGITFHTEGARRAL